MKVLISQVRKEKKVSGAELGRRANIPKTTLYELENEIRSPRLDQLERIAMALDCKISDLFESEYN